MTKIRFITLLLVYAFVNTTYAQAQSSGGITPEFGVVSGILCGLSCGVSAINISNMKTKEASELGPVMGLLSGGGCIYLGVTKFGKNANDRMQTLCIADVALGTASVVCALSHLFIIEKEKEKKVSWNLTGMAATNNQMGFGLSMRRKF